MTTKTWTNSMSAHFPSNMLALVNPEPLSSRFTITSLLYDPSRILAINRADFLADFCASSSLIISGRLGRGSLVDLGPGFTKLRGLLPWLGLAFDSVFRLRWRPVPSPSRMVVRAAVGAGLYEA